MSDEALVEAELPLERVGARLMRAREASGMSRAQMAAVTKIPERHLSAIEASNFAALPARTYAVGFSRSYAKALGLDESEIVAAVRAELADQDPSPSRALPAFEPGDPARVPGGRLVLFAALAALGVVIAGLAFAWRSYYLPGGDLPSILPTETAAPAPVPAAQATPAATPNGPVVFTALAPAVWVKFYDGTGKQLMQKEMAQGETWTVPQDVPEVKIWTAHPEALGITIGGQPVAKLAEEQKTIKDVPVTAAALLGRGAPTATPPSGNPAGGATVSSQSGKVAAATPHRAPQRQVTAPAAPVATQAVPAQLPPAAAAPVPSPAGT